MIIEGYRESDTITGEASPPGRGGISVIRISGKNTFTIVAEIFDQAIPDAGQFKFGKLHYLNKPKEFIDQVVVSSFKNPHSYTGDDVIELSLHGNPIIVSKILEELYTAGARAAQPGEFTFRAFINGRIDLTQAEAVSDLISSGSTQSAGSAMQRLEGSLKNASEEVSGKLLSLISVYELELDFVEENVEVSSKAEKETLIREIITCLQEMLVGYKHNHCLREGVQVAIVGLPNVGKSSLFNRLIDQERAITHHKAGTTRDQIDSILIINGIEFKLTDTAGLRKTTDEVEIKGVERTLQLSAQSDLVLEVSSVDIKAEYSYIGRGEQTVIRILNKIDLESDSQINNKHGVSAIDGTGIDALRNTMYQLSVGDEAVSQRTVNNERQYHLAEKALIHARCVKKSIKSDNLPEIIAEEIRESLGCMDEMTGKRKLDTVLEHIFSKFCIGK